jgi:protein tyrosine phosphatase (PTP) superfamily phosphohydrolase (DUF442 family)
MSVTEIYNFIQLDPATATSGQPSADQFRAARAAGYDVVINLAPDGLPTSLPDEAGLLAELGIAYHHIPVPWAAPDLTQLDRFCAVMETVAGSQKLIHCQANFRVTAFYALYAMAKLGWSRAQAEELIDRIWSSRPGFQMDEIWQAFVGAGMARATA